MVTCSKMLEGLWKYNVRHRGCATQQSLVANCTQTSISIVPTLNFEDIDSYKTYFLNCERGQKKSLYI